MVSSQAAYLAGLCALAAERVWELRRSSRNVRRSLSRGGLEVGRRHYRLMAAFHAVFLAACAVEVVGLGRPFPGGIGWVALCAALGAQALRYWAIWALGDRWSTRIVLVPGESPVTRGPYRWVRHPNYLAVIVEMAAVPLIHGAWLTALAFSAGNAALLCVRIRAEERALGESYAHAFADRRRFVPVRRR